MKESPAEQAPRQLTPQLSRKQLAAIVYVAIALLAVVIVSAETYRNTLWFSAVNSLYLKTANPTFHFENQSLGYPFVRITATLQNPTRFNGIQVNYIVYQLFVDSSSHNESFLIRAPDVKGQLSVPEASSEIGVYGFAVQQSVLPMKSLNITANVPLLADAVDPLKSFIQTHNQSNMATYVEARVYMNSVYGAFVNDLCYEEPSNVSTVCPGIRPVPNLRTFGG